MQQLVHTSGGMVNDENNVEGQESKIEDNSSSALGPSASLKFSKMPQQFKKQLHSCYHSKQDQFTRFAFGFQFTQNEIFYLKIIIESEYAEQCVLCGKDNINTNNNNDAALKQNYKNIEKQNIDSIDAYFVEQIDFIKEYQALVKSKYAEQSQQHFNGGNTTNLQIKLHPIKEQIAELLDKFYTIADPAEPDPPLIRLLNGEADDLLIQILDQNVMLNDKYEIVINDTIHNEFMFDNKQQYITLDNILPLTKYSISARRYNAAEKKWSKYCESVDIITNFKCLWSKDLHGINVRLTNLCRDLYCKSKRGSCTIFGDIRYILRASRFKEVTFSFTMHELAQYAYFGFIEYPMNNDEFKNDVGSYFDNNLVMKHPKSYCLGCCNGSDIQRWITGSKKGRKKNLQNKDLKLQNGDKIKNGDVFIFHINFEQMSCNVYINQKSKENIICVQTNGKFGNTFSNIPHNILPAYSHENNSYIVANSKVSINIENYVLRS